MVFNRPFLKGAVMKNLLDSTYTVDTLKENILKVLDEYSENGTIVSTSEGFLGDIERKMVSTLNICLRRVLLSMPRLEETFNADLTVDGVKLPHDFGELKGVYAEGVGNIPAEKCIVDTKNGVLRLMGIACGTGLVITYEIMPEPFSNDMPGSRKIRLPDITTDALCYLTAAELCPAESTYLYDRLMYKYRDLCLNNYGVQNRSRGRNSFFSPTNRRMWGR